MLDALDSDIVRELANHIFVVSSPNWTTFPWRYFFPPTYPTLQWSGGTCTGKGDAENIEVELVLGVATIVCWAYPSQEIQGEVQKKRRKEWKEWKHETIECQMEDNEGIRKPSGPSQSNIRLIMDSRLCEDYWKERNFLDLVIFTSKSARTSMGLLLQHWWRRFIMISSCCHVFCRQRRT